MLFQVMLVSIILQAQEPGTSQDDSNDATESHTNIYFLQKNQQPNGGGPDAVRWKKLPDTLVKRLQGEDDFWYVNYEFDKIKKKKQQATYDKDTKRKSSEEERPTVFQSGWFQTLLWIFIIGGFVTFIIIFLANSNAGLFRRKNTAIQSDEEMELITDNIFEINYQKEIDKAVSNGNYNFAVRLMFLRVLRNLTDKKIIQYTPDRTNFDYLLQLQPTDYYKDFFKLTRNYEYSWYGHFDVDMERYSWIRRDFENFDQKLR